MDQPRIETSSVDVRVVLPSTLEVSQVKRLYDALGPALKRSTPILIDAVGVTRVDTACLQLLAAFILSAREAGRAVSWAAISAELAQAAALLDLKATLGIAK